MERIRAAECRRWAEHSVRAEHGGGEDRVVGSGRRCQLQWRGWARQRGRAGRQANGSVGSSGEARQSGQPWRRTGMGRRGGEKRPEHYDGAGRRLQARQQGRVGPSVLAWPSALSRRNMGLGSKHSYGQIREDQGGVAGQRGHGGISGWWSRARQWSCRAERVAEGWVWSRGGMMRYRPPLLRLFVK